MYMEAYTIGLGQMMLCAVLSGCHGAGGFSPADAITIARSGSFELDMTPDAALPLFTAPGEKLWIDHWDPVILSGDGFGAGTVFVTAHHGHTTYWHVVDYDSEAHHARYVRVTPDVKTGSVDVTLESNGKGGCVVRVTYRLTALSADGKANLQEAYNAPKYAEMMKAWRTMITDHRAQIDDHFGRRPRA